MRLDERVVHITYGQILVHREGHPAPNRLWSDDHVAQGFAWTEGAVSFGVPDHDGCCRLRVSMGGGPPVEAALWAVQIPFESFGKVEVGTLFEKTPLELPAGRYALAFAAFEGAGGEEEEVYLLELVFRPEAAPGFRILKQGELASERVLAEGSEAA